MYQNKYISHDQYKNSIEEDLEIKSRDPKEFYVAEDFTEEVRKFLYSLYGYKALYVYLAVFSRTF